MKMTASRFAEIAGRYSTAKIAVLGDFCLDRYLEIDPDLAELSLETGLPVHNVTAVRAQPGAAGTVLNNLVALGVGTLPVVGFCGEDGEGYELVRSLKSLAGVTLEYFLTTPLRRTFTYCKPLVILPGLPPQELNRLDSKNWTPTPAIVEDHAIAALRKLADEVDAIVVMDQVDQPETGVVTPRVRDELDRIASTHPRLRILADSRRGLEGWSNVMLKMNAVELAKMQGVTTSDLSGILSHAAALSKSVGQNVLITLAERGLVGATPAGEVAHVPSRPVRGPIDIVGAGDAVTGNLIAAIVAEATLQEVLEIASLAASVVIHKLGTTGTATRSEIADLIV